MINFSCALYWNGPPPPVIQSVDHYILDPRPQNGKESSVWSCILTERESLGCSCCETAILQFLSPDATNHIRLFEGYQLTKNPFRPAIATCILLKQRNTEPKKVMADHGS